jgi:hypothetical protein
MGIAFSYFDYTNVSVLVYVKSTKNCTEQEKVTLTKMLRQNTRITIFFKHFSIQIFHLIKKMCHNIALWVKRVEHGIWNFTLPFCAMAFGAVHHSNGKPKNFISISSTHQLSFSHEKPLPTERPTGWGGNKERWKFSFLASSEYIYFSLSLSLSRTLSLCRVPHIAAMKIFLFPPRCTYFSDTHSAMGEAVRSETLFNREGWERTSIALVSTNSHFLSISLFMGAAWKERERELRLRIESSFMQADRDNFQ